MPLLALPHGDEVQHVHALCLLALLFASVTAKLYAPDGKERALGRGVHHLDEPRVEVDLRGQRRNRYERRAPDRQDRRHRLVEKALVAVGRLLQDQHVAARALGRSDLRGTQRQSLPGQERTLAYRSKISFLRAETK